MQYGEQRGVFKEIGLLRKYRLAFLLAYSVQGLSRTVSTLDIAPIDCIFTVYVVKEIEIAAAFFLFSSREADPVLLTESRTSISLICIYNGHFI